MDDTAPNGAVDAAGAARTIPAMPTMPLVGRDAELATIRATLDAAADGAGRTLFLAGDSGVGKTRLAEAARAEAKQRGWRVAVGRANAVESDLPYALLADALLPGMLAPPDEQVRAAMAGAMEGELAVLFPALTSGREGGEARPRVRESTDFRNRLFWNFAQFLENFARSSPLLIILEDLQWADPSSLELFHFLARQSTASRIAFIATYRTDGAESNKWQRDVERSLISLGRAKCHTVGPLTYAATAELVQRTFGIPETISRPFTALLFGWTRGNAFFIEEVLKTLVETGSLRKERGAWVGWQLEELTLPQSVRETVMLRANRLSEPAMRGAELAAVLGGRFSFEQLAAVMALSTAELLPVVDELERQRIIVDTDSTDSVTYEFGHPIVRETIYANLGRARIGVLHGIVAQTLEQYYGEDVPSHAGELAYHYTRAIDRSLADKAVDFLEKAGRAALDSRANPEARNYLRAAIDRIDDGVTARSPSEVTRLISSLAHAHQRMGQTDAAIGLWDRARAIAEKAGDTTTIARIERRLGLAHYWAGRAGAALEHFEAGSAAAMDNGDKQRLAMLRVARGLCLQELGRPEEALEELQAALEDAKSIGEPSLLARVHRALLLMYLWTGPPELATSHGEQALALAEQTGDRVLSFWVHWAMAVLAGFSGDSARLVAHIGHCDSVAAELGSPLLRIWSAEIAVEFAFGDGRWDEGLAIGENAISMARALNQSTLLPRLLVWTALIHIGRDDIERGRACVEEAWKLARAGTDAPQAQRAAAGEPADGVPSVHVVIPAHIGRAALHLANEDYTEAIEAAEAGLEIVDRTGYDVWAVHRLLPIAAESALYLGDIDKARHYGARLRAGAERFGNLLGLAWADACDGLTVWLAGEAERGAELMRQAVAALDAIPFRFDAARLRRQVGGRLLEAGERDAALTEFRAAHTVFVELGAEKELERVRKQFVEAGSRPPPRRAPGGAGLTGRELEVALALAEGLSNKMISRKLNIAVRTVTTHVTNIYRKLDISSRQDVAQAIRKAEHAGEFRKRSPG